MNNFFNLIKDNFVGKKVRIYNCDFIPQGTEATIVGLTTNIKDVLVFNIIDTRTKKLFTIDINNKKAQIEIV